MNVFCIELGETPEAAHARLSTEAFFPVRKQDLFFKNCDDDGCGPLFRQPLYGDLPFDESIKLARHFGILDVERRNIICCVTHENYELIKNSYACEIAFKHIIPKLFPCAAGGTFLCNNVLVSNSRGQCYMDLCCQGYTLPLAFDDPWLPFLRVANSYNRSLKLSYRMGFCNAATADRVIFSDRTIDLDSVHNDVVNQIEQQVFKSFRDIQVFERHFYEGLLRLSKYFFHRKKMLELFCKVFGISEAKALGRRTTQKKARNHEIVQSVLKWTDTYFGRNGDSAYAAFCVLTACASRPAMDIKNTPVTQVDRAQSSVGEWATEFVQEVASDQFNIDSYMGKDYKRAAEVLKSDYEDLERQVVSSMTIEEGATGSSPLQEGLMWDEEESPLSMI